VKYIRVLNEIAATLWAMDPIKLQIMLESMRAKADGVDLLADVPESQRVETYDPRLARNHGGVFYTLDGETDFSASISPQQASGIARKSGKVAVLPIRGIISHRMGGIDEMSGGTSSERLAKALAELRDTDSIKAVVLDVDSPGGSTFGAIETADAIYSMRGVKPVVAQVNATAASLAYWYAVQAEEVVVTPSAAAGSIGVYSVHKDISEMLSKAGIKPTIVKDGENKAEGSEFGPLSEDARAHLQEMVSAMGNQFRAHVARGRGVSASDVKANFGDGRMFLADELVKRGMADRVATMEQTLNRFGASLNGAKPQAKAQQSFAAYKAKLNLLQQGL